MKPFSALYFIKENKVRCMLLIFMIFLGYAAYLGGLYATNVRDCWELPLHYYGKMVLVSNNGEENQIEQYERFMEEAADDDRIDVLYISFRNALNWKTIMGFENGQFAYTFASVEDFKMYCAHMDIECDTDSLKEGSMIMSEKMSKNRNLQIGDKIDKDDDEKIFGEYTLDAVTKEDGYPVYFIDPEIAGNDFAMLFSDELGVSGLSNYIQKEYGNILYGEQFEEEVEGWFEFFNSIYLFVVMILALILAVTICAAFMGMYQRRNFEFAVYRAIGISKRRIIGKIAGELLWMDLIALTAGGAIFFLGLYLLNNQVLYPIGKYLRYFHPVALIGLGFCNIMVLVPLILTRCRQMLKADICKY